MTATDIDTRGEANCTSCVFSTRIEPTETPPYYCPECGTRTDLRRGDGVDLDAVKTKTDKL